MNLFAFGMLVGVIVAIIFMSVVKIKDDRTMDKGQLNNDSSVDVHNSGTGGESRDLDIHHWYKHPKGSKTYEEEIMTLLNGLLVMRQILGLSRREKEMLGDTILYIEENEGL